MNGKKRRKMPDRSSIWLWLNAASKDPRHVFFDTGVWMKKDEHKGDRLARLIFRVSPGTR
jgi:hypothetical protein